MTSAPEGGSPVSPDGREPRRRRRARLVLAAVGTVLVVLCLVAVLIAQSRDETGPLDADAPALADFKMQAPEPCSYDADRGGLVSHFDVSTREAGRFTVDLKAVTDEGADNLDVPTTHVVRVTVPFYGGRTRQRFDVVVPLSQADYQDGYRTCRYEINPTGSD